ncbi:TolC family protein [Uliginosibacterium sp. 31-16]|uniref:TolC family protein n=1 Tax=Uliginosibacterium sp. 31-16 TaxID=3068315 RepID=UPI00273E9033|nr:TolC family protein [Uliginosibacterium sp. 31-16]MDP5239508.1 TolC family protein [Uliginosibacterium sp. 31-16]
MKHSFPVRPLALLIVLFWQAMAFNAQAQEKPVGADLNGLLEYAKAHNVEYSAMRHEAEAAAERIGSAGALPDPKLQVELRDITKMGEQNPTLDPSRVGSTRYLLMQDFPWYGKRDLRTGVATAEARAAEGLVQSNWTELSALIRQTFLQRYFLDRNERLVQEQLAQMAQLEKIAQARYAGGLTPQQDVIRAQLEQNAMRAELIGVSGERRALGAKLNAVLNRPTAAPLEAPGELPATPNREKLNMGELIERLRSNNPQVVVESHRITAAEQNRELTYKNRYPDISLGVSPIQSGNRINEWELMLQVNIPLQQGARRSQEREANAMLAAARARQEAATQRLFGELAENLSAYETAQQSEELVRGSVLPQSELSFKSALAGYENGKVDFATLLEAQRQITQARVSMLKAQAEQHLRLTNIEKLIGEAL